MYGLKSEILDRAMIDGIEWVLIKTPQFKHFKNGKPNQHVEITYHVEMNDPTVVRCGRVGDKQRFNMKSKREAALYFKSLTSKAVVVERTGAAALNRIFG